MFKIVFNKIKNIKVRLINMFKFTKNSGLVRSVWVSLILSGTYTLEQCPALFNLRECVEEVLKEVGFIKEDKKDVAEHTAQ